MAREEEGYTLEELRKIAAEKPEPKLYRPPTDAQIRARLKGKEAAKKLAPDLVELKRKREMEKIRDIAPQFYNYKRTSDEVEGPGLLDRMKEYAKEKFPTLRSQEEVEARLQEKAKREGIGLTDSWRQDSRVKSRLDDYSARKEATDKMMDEEYDKRTLASVPLFQHQKERHKRRGELEGIPLSELEANQAGEIQNKLERLKYQRHVLGIPYPGETFETGHMKNEIMPGLHKKQYGKTKEDTEMSELDRLAETGIGRLSSERQAGIEEQMMEGMAQDKEKMMKRMAQDEEERAVNEEFTVQENMQNMPQEEAKEVFEEIAKTAPNGRQDEGYLAAKEATGRYVRYEGAGTGEGGFVLNKGELDNLFDRKEKMNLLQNIPQEDRAALLHKWKLIDDEDFNLTQKKSAKELLELEKLKLQIAELKSKSSTEKMSDSDKAQFNAAASGFQDAVKSRRWDEAQAYSDTLESILPGSQKNFNVDNVQKAIDDRLKKLPPLQKAKSQMGKEVFNGYFSFRNKLVEKIDLVKRSGDSKALDQLLGTTIDTGDNKGKTWSDILEGQGIPSWQTIEGMAAGDKPEIALAITNGKSNNISEISRQQYMGYVLPRIRDKIMKGNYGKWHDMIEGGLRTAQDNKTTELQEKVNNPKKSDPLKEVERIEEPDDKLSKMKKNLTEEEEVELEDEAVFLKENDQYGLYEGPLGNARLRNKLVEMLQRKKDREANQKGSKGKKRYGSRSIKVR